MISVLLLLNICQAIDADFARTTADYKIQEIHDVSMLQLSDNNSGENNSGFDDDSRILMLFLLNIIGCALCCGFIQGVIMLSKKLTAYQILLKKNYKKYNSLLRFKEFRNTYCSSDSNFNKSTEP